MQPSNAAFEVCVETAQALTLCQPYADRIELCTGLAVGGLTPSLGLMKQAKAAGVETHVLIRPRAGDFVYDAAEKALILSDILAVRDLGLAGVVVGAATDGGLDLAFMRDMIAAAGGMDVTLHRVIDVVDDPLAALDAAIDLGITRVLTSGGAASAPAGIAGLAALHKRAAGQIEVMAGGGISAEVVPKIAAQTGITSFHASCTTPTALDAHHVVLGFGTQISVPDAAKMRAMRDAIDALT